MTGPTSELSHTLKRNSLRVETRIISNPHGRAGEAILSAAASPSSDLLVEGASTRCELRQFIFGGATNHILSITTVRV